MTYRTARAETFAREERGVTDETKESETESHQRHVSGGPVSPTSRQAQRDVVVTVWAAREAARVGGVRGLGMHMQR